MEQGRKRRRDQQCADDDVQLSTSDHATLRLLSKIPQLQAVRPQGIRGRRGAIYVGDLTSDAFIDALGESLGASGTPTAEKPDAGSARGVCADHPDTNALAFDATTTPSVLHCGGADASALSGGTLDGTLASTSSAVYSPSAGAVSRHKESSSDDAASAHAHALNCTSAGGECEAGTSIAAELPEHFRDRVCSSGSEHADDPALVNGHASGTTIADGTARDSPLAEL